ncbi:MAG: DUF2470 domain-containing protein [Acidobacteriota bacterium]|nr:DUF2470 domain-containing protein [Acidobacteriota bacterium]
MSNRQHAGPASNESAVPEPSLAERARTLVSLGRMGALSTHSRKFPAFPFGSVMPYASDEEGRPVFFVSSMAMHTQNMQQDGHASLLIAQPDASDDPLGAARVTLLGSASQVAASAVKDLYLARQENAKYWQDYTDFSFYRLEITGVYFIGGFGVMGWVSADDYRTASPDPLAGVARQIMDHMNADHADALRSIARHFTGEAADEAVMTAVDRLGFHVRLKTSDGVHGQRIPFPKQVTSTSEARCVLVEMVRQARDQAIAGTEGSTEGSAPIVPANSVR